MNDNLISMNKLKDEIQSMKLLSIFLNPDDRKKVKVLEQQLHHLTVQFDKFIKYFLTVVGVYMIL